MTDLDDLNLDCVICKEHFYFPILTPCGHHFCKDCILNWIDMNDLPTCPICKTRFPFYFANEYIKDCKHDYFLDQIVRSKCLVDCIYQINGCEEKILPKELSKHTSKCLYKRIRCLNYKYGCTEYIIRRDLLEHKNDCEFNPCYGNKYGCEEIGTVEEMDLHSASCIYNRLGHRIEKRILDKFENILEQKMNQIKNERTLPRLNPLPLPPPPTILTPTILRRTPILPISFMRNNRDEQSTFNNELSEGEINESPTNIFQTNPQNLQFRLITNRIRNNLISSQNNSNISTHNNLISMQITTPRLQELSREMLSILNNEVSNSLR